MAETNHDIGKLASGQKIMLATTSYDNPDSNYTYAIQQSRAKLGNTAYLLLRGNAHVDDARNEVVRTFLASDCTELLFLDADVSWTPEQLQQLIDRDVALVGGVYPHRRDKPDEMPVRLMSTEPLYGLLEVEGLPTGFMKIKRAVFEMMASHCETYQDTTIFFERTLINGTRWGGDLNFCNKWRSIGGKVYADYELVLGHTGKTTYRDSLGAFLRRQDGTTLRHVANKVRAGTETVEDIAEAVRYTENKWAADAGTIIAAIKLASLADGPIIESGSGLSTVLMAAATKQTVYCLEHSAVWYERLKEMCAEAGVVNVGICRCDIKNGWYDVKDELPVHFALGLNDGPPRRLGSRMGFFDRFNPDVIVCDDVDDLAYRQKVEARFKGRDIQYIEPRTMIIRNTLSGAA
jgi:hypothetical protein